MAAQPRGWAELQRIARERKLRRARAVLEHSQRTGQTIASRPLAFWVGMLARSQLQAQQGDKGNGKAQ